MKIPALPAVECAILHEAFKPMNGGALFSAIEALAAKYGFSQSCQLMVTSTEKDVHVLAGNYRILVSQNSEPLGPEGFRTALTTPFTGMIFPDAREAVERHRANSFITVGKGPVSLPEEMFRSDLGSALADLSAFTTSEDAARAMKLCQELAQMLIGGNPASAIHWCVSDNLVPQAFFDRAIAANDPTLLNIRPFLTSSAGRMGEGLPIGITANGSQWLLGKMVAFDEAKVPLPWMLETLYGFVNLCLVRGSLIPHMDTFSVEGEDWQVGVFHEKIDGFDGWELVRLKLLHHPKFGIHGQAKTKRQFEYKSVEDVRRRAEEEKREVKAANDLPEGRAGFADAGGVNRAGEMARLRNLAISSAANQQKTVTRAEGGLLNKFRSLLPGKAN